MDSEKKIVDLDSFVIEFVKYIDYPESCHLSNSLNMSKANKWLRDNYNIDLKIPKIKKLMIREQDCLNEDNLTYKNYVHSVISYLVDTKDIVSTMITFKDEYLKFNNDVVNFENNLAALYNIQKRKQHAQLQKQENDKDIRKSNRLMNSIKKNVERKNNAKNCKKLNINYLNKQNKLISNKNIFERQKN